MILHWITGTNINDGLKQGTVDEVKSILLNYINKNLRRKFLFLDLFLKDRILVPILDCQNNKFIFAIIFKNNNTEFYLTDDSVRFNYTLILLNEV